MVAQLDDEARRTNEKMIAAYKEHWEQCQFGHLAQCMTQDLALARPDDPMAFIVERLKLWNSEGVYSAIPEPDEEQPEVMRAYLEQHHVRVLMVYMGTRAMRSLPEGPEALRDFLINLLQTEAGLIADEVEEAVNPGLKARREASAAEERRQALQQMQEQRSRASNALREERLVAAQHRRARRVCVTGASGSGKYTLCQKLLRRYHMVHLHVGQLVQAEIEAGSHRGLQAKAFVEAGQLAPDDVVCAIVRERLQASDVQERGYLLDGFPRDRVQAEMMIADNILPEHIFVLAASTAVLMDRSEHALLNPASGKSYDSRKIPASVQEQIGDLLIPFCEDPAQLRAKIETFNAALPGMRALFQQSAEGRLLSFVELDASLNRREVLAECLAHLQGSAKKFVIAGAPASGKGTQALKIINSYGVVHVAPGVLLRQAIKRGDPIGLKAKKYMDAGRYVPDELVIKLVQDRLNSPDCRMGGWLLDGYPRTAAQAEALVDAGVVPEHYFLLEVSADTLIDRCVHRRVDPVTGAIYNLETDPPPDQDQVLERLVQREDDKRETIARRVALFEQNILGVSKLFRHIQHSIAGRNSLEHMVGDACAVLVPRAHLSTHFRSEEWASQPAAVMLERLLDAMERRLGRECVSTLLGALCLTGGLSTRQAATLLAGVAPLWETSELDDALRADTASVLWPYYEKELELLVGSHRGLVQLRHGHAAVGRRYLQEHQLAAMELRVANLLRSSGDPSGEGLWDGQDLLPMCVRELAWHLGREQLLELWRDLVYMQRRCVHCGAHSTLAQLLWLQQLHELGWERGSHVEEIVCLLQSNFEALSQEPALLWEAAYNMPDKTHPSEAAHNGAAPALLLQQLDKLQQREVHIRALGLSDQAHSGVVTCCGVVRDEHKLRVTGSSDGTCRVWDSTQGDLLAVLHLGAAATCLGFASNGTVSTGDAAGSVVLWAASAQPTVHYTVPVGARVDALAFSTDSKRLAVASAHAAATVSVFEVSPESSTLLARFVGHSAPISCICFDHSAHGARVLTGSQDHDLRLWELDPAIAQPHQEHQCAAVLSAHTARVSMGCFDVLGDNSVISTAEDGSVRVWDLALCGAEGYTEQCKLRARVSELSIERDLLSSAVESCGAEVAEAVRLKWAEQIGRMESRLLELLESTNQAKSSWVELAQEPFIGSADLQQVLGQALERLGLDPVQAAAEGPGLLDKLTAAHDAVQQAVQEHTAHNLELVGLKQSAERERAQKHEAATQGLREELQDKQRVLEGVEQRLTELCTQARPAVAWTPERQPIVHAAYASSYGSKLVCVMGSAMALYNMHPPHAAVSTFLNIPAPDPDPEQQEQDQEPAGAVAEVEGQAGPAADGEAAGVEVEAVQEDEEDEEANHRLIGVVEHSSEVSCVGFDQDSGQLLLTGSQGRALEWDITVWGASPDRHSGAVASVASSTDGKWIASLSPDGELRVWDKPAARCEATLCCAQGGSAVQFLSEDGGMLAVGLLDGGLEFWDASNELKQRESPGTGDAVCVLETAPNRATLGVGRQSGSIDLWHLEQALVWATLDAQQEQPVRCLQWTPDSGQLLSASGPVVALWEAPSGKLLQSTQVLVREDGARPREQAQAAVCSMSLSEDGTVLAASVARDVCLFTLSGRQLNPSVSLRRAHSSPVCSVLCCNGELLTSSQTEFRVWGLASVVSSLQAADLRGLEHSSAEALEAQQQLEHKADTLAGAHADCDSSQDLHLSTQQKLQKRREQLEQATSSEAEATRVHQAEEAALEELKGPNDEMQELLEAETAALEEDKAATKEHSERLVKFKKEHAAIRKGVEAGEATDQDLEAADAKKKEIETDLTTRTKMAEHRKKELKKIKVDAAKAKKEFVKQSEIAGECAQQAAQAVAALHVAQDKLATAVKNEKQAAQNIVKSARRLVALKAQAAKRYEEHRCAQAQGALQALQSSFDTSLRAQCLLHEHAGFRSSLSAVQLVGGAQGVVLVNGSKIFSKLSLTAANP